MKTVIIGSAQRRQALTAESDSGDISPRHVTTGRPPRRHRHEEWRQKIEEDWQSHLETLQQYVRNILHESYRSRVTPVAVGEQGRSFGDAIHL
jgi:hypothetical protein